VTDGAPITYYLVTIAAISTASSPFGLENFLRISNNRYNYMWQAVLL